MNLFTKRLGLVLAGVIGVGAIASLAVGASFALFSSTSGSNVATFSAGTVSFNTNQASAPTTCTETNLAPGDSSTGYNPTGLFALLGKGNQTDPPCSIGAEYTGSLDAWIGLDVSVTSTSAPGYFYSPVNLTGLTGPAECEANPGTGGGFICDNYALINNTDGLAAIEQFEIKASDTSGGPPGSAPSNTTVTDINLVPTCSYSGTQFTSNFVQTCTFQTPTPVEIATASGETTPGQVASQVADQLDYFLPNLAGNGYQGASASITESFVAVQYANNNNGHGGPISWS